eukprot:scaffold41430_cov206-Amphora_coffeaeformis.AAC.2
MQDIIIGRTGFDQERIHGQASTSFEGLTLGNAIVSTTFHHDGNDIVLQLPTDERLIHLIDNFVTIGNVKSIVSSRRCQVELFRVLIGFGRRSTSNTGPRTQSRQDDQQNGGNPKRTARLTTKEQGQGSHDTGRRRGHHHDIRF